MNAPAGFPCQRGVLLRFRVRLRLHFSAERDLDQLFGESERGNPDEVAGHLGHRLAIDGRPDLAAGGERRRHINLPAGSGPRLPRTGEASMIVSLVRLLLAGS